MPTIIYSYWWWWLLALACLVIVAGMGVWNTKLVKLFRAIKLENRGTQLIIDGYYEKAETLLIKSLRLAEEAVGPDDTEVGPILGNLAQANRLQNKFDEAEPLYERAIAIYENYEKQAGNEEHPFLVLALNDFAQMYQAPGLEFPRECPAPA